MTDDGYLVAVSKVARTGVQDYLASEIGLSGDGIVKVNRSPDEVFSKDAMSSITHAPVTVDHPSEMVGAENWKEVAVGEVGEGVIRDGEWLAVPLILKDAKGIDAANTSHKEISMGYTAKLVAAQDGDEYDLEMTDIRFNHLAIVSDARAGKEARIGDSSHKWGAAPTTTEHVKMTMKTVVLGDKAVEVAAKDADTVTQILKDHKTAMDAKDAIISDKETKIGELKAENADTAKKVISDADIEKMVADRMVVVEKAKSVNSKFISDGKTVPEIKRETVKGVYGDTAASSDISDAEINGIFKVMQLEIDDSARNALKGKKNAGDDPWAKFVKKGDK